MALSLSKSKYISGLQCPKLLWHLYNKPEALPAADDATQAMFDQGHDIGDYAKQLYPTGIEVAWGRGFSYTLTRTQELLGIKRPIFEGSFSYANVYARVDLLVPVDGGWELIEVKSSTEVKDVHIEDVALQLFVLQGCSVPVVRCSVMTVDTTYVRDGAIDATRLLKTEDVTARVLAVLPLVSERVASMLALIAADCPTVKIGPQCSTPYECALKETCWAHLPPHNVTELYYAGKKAFPILDTYTLIADVPLELLSEKQKTQQDAIIAGHAIVDKTAIASWLSRLTYPLYLLDFETINPAVPLWDGTRPYQQVPFQLSIHIVESAEELATLSEAKHSALPQQTESAQQTATTQVQSQRTAPGQQTAPALPPCDTADGANATSVNVSQNIRDTENTAIHAAVFSKNSEGRGYERAAEGAEPLADGRLVNPEKSAEGPGATQGGTADAQGAKGIRHVEFLAQDTTDPRAAVAAALHAIGPSGTVLAYNASFEKRVIKELAELFPDEKTFLLGIDARVDDLLIPFKNFWYYHPAQHGSCSIKAVLPAMTGRSYAGLEVADGGAAQRAWLSATFGGLAEEERSRLFTALLAYCKQDTEAMGEVLRGLQNTTKN